jgi:serine/threonine-protein kinase
MALLARHSLDNVPSLKIVRGTVPDAVEDAIVRAMAKVPADRFRSATDFAAAMTDHAGAARRRQDSIKAKAIAAETVERPALGGGSKKKAMIAAAVAVPLLAAGGWFAWQQTRAPATPEGLSGDYAKSNIAVMYFEDRSPKKELAYLADGLTESLIDELSAVPQLKVASRNASATFKDKIVPSDSIARVLKVGTVVSGTVEPTGDGGVRLTVRLDDALTNAQIGKTQLVQPAGNSLALQDSLARQVSFFLRKQVGQEIQDLTTKIGTRNAQSWEALQRAKQTIAEVDKLIAARDVPAALARVAQADSALAKVEAMDDGWVVPTTQRGWLAFKAGQRVIGPAGADYGKWLEAGLGHAERALKKAPNDPDATEVRGTLHYLQWLTNRAPNPSAATALLASAEQDLRAATEATGHRASAWNMLSHLLMQKGQLSEGKLAAEEAYRADPFLTNADVTIHRAFIASLNLNIRDEAEKWCKEGQTRFPQNFRFVECKLWLYALPAQTPPNIAEAWQTYDAYVKASPPSLQEFNKLQGKMMVALALVRANQLDSAKSLATASQGTPQVDPRRALANLAAIVYSQAGDKDAALDLIAKVLAANPQERAIAANDKSWWLEDLRLHPRFKSLVKVSN